MFSIVFFLELFSSSQSLKIWSEPTATFSFFFLPSLPLPSHHSVFLSPFPWPFSPQHVSTPTVYLPHWCWVPWIQRWKKSRFFREQVRGTEGSKPHFPVPESVENSGQTPGCRRELLRGGELCTNTKRQVVISQGFPGGAEVKNFCLPIRETTRSLVGKIPWKRKWQPAPVFLHGKFHWQRRLEGYSAWNHKESDTSEQWAAEQWLTRDLKSMNAANSIHKSAERECWLTPLIYLGWKGRGWKMRGRDEAVVWRRIRGFLCLAMEPEVIPMGTWEPQKLIS